MIGATYGLIVVALGLSVPQAMLIIVVSRLLVVLFSILIAWIGLKWHVGFTVQNRYSWGLRGSFIPLSQRILLNFIWNAVQCKFLPRRRPEDD
jgi:NCS1 family nucleobase:cation symporter-1